MMNSRRISLVLKQIFIVNLLLISLIAKAQNQTKAIKKVLINAVGFGGNAVSILIEKA